MKRQTPLTLIHFTLVLLGVCLHARAQTVFVVPSASFPTIQSALNATVAGDVVSVGPGTYFENLLWPAHDVTVSGAGVGQSIIDGGGLAPCLKMKGDYLSTCVFEGFTLQNGYGAPSLYGASLVAAGGGIHLDVGPFGFTSPTIRNCEITSCSGVHAAAIFFYFAGNPVFENLHVHANVLANINTLTEAAIVDIKNPGAFPTFRRCLFENHVGSATATAAMIGCTGSSATFEDCVFRNNTECGCVIKPYSGNQLNLTRCTFQGNTSSTGAAITGGSVVLQRLNDCLIQGNTATGGGLVATGEIRMRNCTIVDNAGLNPLGFVASSGNLRIVNSILRGNLDSLGNPLASPLQGTVTQLKTSNIEGYATTLPGILDVDPFFVSPSSGDYRLLPGSPCIDSGLATTNLGIGTTDLAGEPRVRLAAVDMGCFEAQELAHHPASAGRVGETAGGPFDVLSINGSTGGALRTITVPIGAASTVEMAQPANVAGPAKFVVFGFLGEADLDSVLMVPLGIGEMMFAPTPMVPPFFQSIFFTFTDNFSPTNPQLTASTPTPWASAAGPGIPFPLTVTFQGVLEESPGDYRPTNAILFRVQ